jgi:ketosteroid isomerase-like protein
VVSRIVLGLALSTRINRLQHRSMKLVAAGLLLCAAPALAAELPPDLARAVHDYDQAQFRNDIATLEHLVADDYLLVNSNATVENKQRFLADFNLPGFKIDPYVLEQPVTRVWGDGAIVGGIVHLGWTQDGKHQTRVLRVAYVWAKRGDRWEATYAQITRVPK